MSAGVCYSIDDRWYGTGRLPSLDVMSTHGRVCLKRSARNPHWWKVPAFLLPELDRYDVHTLVVRCRRGVLTRHWEFSHHVDKRKTPCQKAQEQAIKRAARMDVVEIWRGALAKRTGTNTLITGALPMPKAPQKFPHSERDAYNTTMSEAMNRRMDVVEMWRVALDVQPGYPMTSDQLARMNRYLEQEHPWPILEEKSLNQRIKDQVRVLYGTDLHNPSVLGDGISALKRLTDQLS
jgi:hypothetical protein